MRVLVWLCACVRLAPAVLAALVAHSAIATAETAPLDFAREYVREIVVNERMRALAEKDVTEPNADKMAAINSQQHADQPGAAISY